MDRDQPRLTAQVLKVLGVLTSSQQNEVSGAEINRLANLSSGTLYPILLRLEKAGWVKSHWETEDPRKLGRPRRRFYQMTSVGASRTRSAFREVRLAMGELAWR